MLGKLIKYDLKVSSKLFILLHAAYLFVCIISRILYMNKLDFKGPEEPVIISLALFISVLSILMTALMIFTELHIAFRFYRSMFSREGYLSWTLPRLRNAASMGKDHLRLHTCRGRHHTYSSRNTDPHNRKKHYLCVQPDC